MLRLRNVFQFERSLGIYFLIRAYGFQYISEQQDCTCVLVFTYILCVLEAVFDMRWSLTYSRPDDPSLTFTFLSSGSAKSPLLRWEISCCFNGPFKYIDSSNVAVLLLDELHDCN